MTHEIKTIIIAAVISWLLISSFGIYAAYHYSEQVDKIRKIERNHRYEIADLETKLHLCQTSREMDKFIDSSMNELRKKLGQ
ncbi:hypothetical protein Pan5_67 [Pseudanabaena phage Pan5]|nr:hypothetical protein Pan5_67 [Pseudanabaena phage Pan5]